MSNRVLETPPRPPRWRWLGAAVLAAITGLWLAYRNETGTPAKPDPAPSASVEHKPAGATHSRKTGSADSAVSASNPVQRYQGTDRSSRELLGLEGDSSYATRVAALESLLARGTDEDSKLLYAFLNGEAPADNLAAEERSGLEKLLYESMLTGDQNVDRLKNHLLDLLANPTARESAASAALGSIERLFDRPGSHGDVIAGLWSLQEQENSKLAGPALAALGRIEATHPGTLDKQRLGDTVNALLFRPDNSIEMRVLALRLGSWLELPSAHQVARTAAKAPESDDNVRLTALGIVAEKGSRDDIVWLRELEKQTQYPINAAARRAQKTLEQR